MSLPSDLGTVCHVLSDTQADHLPYTTPTLLRTVFSCGEILAAGDGNSRAADASEDLVLVHKFKTQLTTLVNGKSPGARFAAVVLIKAVVELGGWEILKGSEAWVRGLVHVLAKPDAPEIKGICILTLAKIYAMTHHYQTLLREITTPTLPTFVTSCLNMVPKSETTPSEDLNGRESLVESVFEAFATLIPRHPTIFRPYISQIQRAARLYVAPTMYEACFIPQSLRESACRLIVIVHQTAPKNTSAEEWAKALRLHIKATQATADQVFRAVVEDWESVCGYMGANVDLSAAVHGGSDAAEDFPEWRGIYAGVERLTGMLALLGEYLKTPTAAAVSIPVDALKDLVTRMLLLTKPTRAGRDRINPAIDRHEREGLWAGLPRIHVASMQLLMSLVERLQEGFLLFAEDTLSLVTWLFRRGQLNEEVRTNAYLLIAKLLCCGGPMLPKDCVGSLSPVVLACCDDLSPMRAEKAPALPKEGTKKVGAGTNSNADTYLQSNAISSTDSSKYTSELLVAAKDLLPLLLSHLPQEHLGARLRFGIERTAVIIQNKETMVNSVLSPFVDNNRTLPSLLPHLTREFPEAPVVEALLRPRLPALPKLNPELLDLNNNLDDVDTCLADGMELDEAESTTMSIMPDSSRPDSHDISTALASTKRALSVISGDSPDTGGSILAEASMPLAASSNRHTSAVESTRSTPQPKRGRFSAPVQSAPSTEPIVNLSSMGQHAQVDTEEDSDDEPPASLKMEFDSESDE